MSGRQPWPGGKTFAFTVFDDPDGDTLGARERVYPLLYDLGILTTKAVWPIGPLREINSHGETCADPDFRRNAQELQAKGFEIAYHSAAPHSCTREEVRQSLEDFREYFGAYPASMANHYNADAMYWGQARLTGGTRRAIYNALTLGKNRARFLGQVEGSPYFWGDLCREKIRYCRNLVYRDIDTLAACPLMPYHDPARPFVNEWFSSAEGAECPSFVKTIGESHQDELEASGGLCIMYTHFGKGFVDGGKTDQKFVELITRLSKKNGWFVPVTTLLDFLRKQNGPRVITDAERSELEWRWLANKAFYGTS